MSTTKLTASATVMPSVRPPTPMNCMNRYDRPMVIDHGEHADLHRRPRVVVGVEDAGQRIAAGVGVETQTEEEQGPSGAGRVVGRELSVLEQQPDERIPQQDDADGGRDQQEAHETEGEIEGGFDPLGRIGRDLLGKQGEDGDAYPGHEDAEGQLEQLIGVVETRDRPLLQQ